MPLTSNLGLYSKPIISACAFLTVFAYMATPVEAQHADFSGVADYHQRIQIAAESDALERASLSTIEDIPIGFEPWWQTVMNNRLQAGTHAANVNLESLIVRTLQHSSQVRVFSDLPFIRQTAIVEANSAFDWTQFVNTRWDDLSDPVGNVFTTGGSPRYRNNQWSFDAGMRKKTTSGGYLEAAQEFGFQNTNSNFFQPNDQGTSRIRLSYTQPLKRGRGTVYNTSLIVLAKIDASIAEDEFSRQLQSHLLEVTRAYWSLYLERVSLVQKQQLFLRAEKIFNDLNARAAVDVVESQLVRVKAAVSERKSDLVRAEMAVRNAQDRIHALVNDPELAHVVNLEIIPMDNPVREIQPLDLGEILSTALQSRPEVNQSLKQIKSASVRLGMSRNELLPQLDMVLETYVAGLRGDSDIGRAWTDQFSTGEPGYSVGFQYEIPVCNRAAKARLQRRQLELRQLRNQFDTTVETLVMETKVAAREVRTSEREFKAKYHAMQAAAKRLENIEERWAAIPGKESTIGLYLDQVLEAQVQLAETEFEFAKAETTYNLSLMNLKRATGTLLQHEQIENGVATHGELPLRILSKGEHAGEPVMLNETLPTELEWQSSPAEPPTQQPAPPKPQSKINQGSNDFEIGVAHRPDQRPPAAANRFRYPLRHADDNFFRAIPKNLR